MTFLRTVTLCAVLAGLSGCLPYVRTDWVAVPTDQYNLAADSDDKLKPGDKVLVRNKHTAKTYAFTIVKLTQKGFVGTGRDKKQYMVRFDDISKLEVERRTWGLINSYGFAHL